MEAKLTDPYLAAAARWATLRLDALAHKIEAAKISAAATAVAKAAGPIADLAEIFGLEEDERRVLDLCVGTTASLTASRATGAAGLTVAILRAVLGEEDVRCLEARRALRALGLVSVWGLPGGLPEPGDAVTLAPGLLRRLAGAPAPACDLCDGLVEIAPKEPLEGTFSTLVRDRIGDPSGRWISIGGGQPGDGAPLAAALAARLGKPVLLADGRALGRLEVRALFHLLAALRREALLGDRPLVVDSATALVGAWRALLTPRLASAPSLTLVTIDEGPALTAYPDTALQPLLLSLI